MWLRQTYTCKARFYAGSEETHTKIWYWAEPGAQTFNKYSLTGSQHFMDRNLSQSDWLYPGELPGFDITTGVNPHGAVGLAGCQIGKDAWFAAGVPIGQVLNHADIPVCCGTWPPFIPASTCDFVFADQILVSSGASPSYVNGPPVPPGSVVSLTGPNASMFVPTAPMGTVLIARGTILTTGWWYLVYYWPLALSAPVPVTLPPGVGIGYGATLQDVVFGPYDPKAKLSAPQTFAKVEAQLPANTGHCLYAVVLSPTFFDQARVPHGLTSLTVFTGQPWKASQAGITHPPTDPIGPWYWPLDPPVAVVTVSVMMA